MKKFICLIIALLMVTLAFASCADDSNSNVPTGDTNSDHVAPKYQDIDRSEISSLEGVTASDTETDYVLIDVKSYGKIVVRLYPDVAPATVANFKKLVSEGFYDGLIFHRVIEGFMIQGGDPEGTGSGGSKTPIKGEFTSNGFENNLKHTRGVLSMARTNDPDSASSQFFICHKTDGVSHLDKQYASFGYVIYGMSVVDKIAEVRVDSSDKPLVDVVISSIKFVTVTDVTEEKHDGPSYEEIDLSTVSSLEGVTESDTETDYVIIDVKDYGKMLVRLYPDVAPETVANFKKLVSEGFYDGLIFHRVIKDFMIQGGDPEGTGSGGSDTTIKGEFSANGFENNLKHTRGVLSMARTKYPDSASSQFFICHTTEGVTHLDGSYATFGYVVYGIDVVDAIANVATDTNDKPTTDVVINSIKFATLLEANA